MDRFGKAFGRRRLDWLLCRLWGYPLDGRLYSVDFQAGASVERQRLLISAPMTPSVWSDFIMLCFPARSIALHLT